MIMQDDQWRELINSLKVDDLPIDGIMQPILEQIKQVEGKSSELVFVQKIVTTVYVFSDPNKKVFGSTSFQELEVIGELTPIRLSKLIDRERRKRAKNDAESS